MAHAVGIDVERINSPGPKERWCLLASGRRETTTRSRKIQFRVPRGTLRTSTYRHSTGITTKSYAETAAQLPPAMQGEQVTVSENHPDWRKTRKGNFSGDIGGPFHTKKRFIEFGLPDGTNVFKRIEPDRTTTTVFNGAITPASSSVMSFPPYLPDDSNLDVWGATAIARCKPTNSAADMSTFLGEVLREGLPKLVGLQALLGSKSAPKKGADEFLNYQFGWMPIVNETRSLLNAIVRADRLVDQYIRDAGRIVRRRYSFPPESTASSEVVASNVSPFVWGPTGGAMYGSAVNQGRVIRTYTRDVNRWFSGAFTYYLPGGKTQKTMRNRAEAMREILGLDLTPETLWNLAPWSWAIDWFSNAGDVISNMSDWQDDGLVLRYGYVMEHSLAKHIYTFEGPTGFNGTLRPPPCIYISESKRRVKANPFGFGLTWSGLSPIQLAIAAALGISKS